MNTFEDVRRLPRALRAHLQNTESKNLNFHEKHGNLLLILPMFFRHHKWNFFLKSMQKHRNSGVVAWLCWKPKIWYEPSFSIVFNHKKISEISTARAPLEPYQNKWKSWFSPKNGQKTHFLVPCADRWLRSALGRRRTSKKLFTRFELQLGTIQKKSNFWPRTPLHLAA